MLLPEEKMTALLVDMNVADLIVRKYPLPYRDSVRDLLTQSLLKIHDVSRDELDTNLYLYQLYPEKYKRVTQLTLDQLEDLKD